MKKEAVTSELKQQVNNFKGKYCIYRESGLYIHSLINEIITDDWGVRITLKDMDSPGFTGELRYRSEVDTWRVSAGWETFSFSLQKWGASYIGWTIFFGPELIKGVCRYAKTLIDLDDKQRQKSLRNCIYQIQTKKSFLYIKRK